MKEKPILFSGEMIRAILGGRKSQTRRVIKPQPKHCQLLRDGRLEISPDGGFDHDLEYQSCPYPVGTRQWVRETFALSQHDPESAEVDTCNPDDWDEPVYRADEQCGEWTDEKGNKIKAPWRPSIFMPKWVARLWNDVTKVRVERVQDISEEDARAEGVKEPNSIASDRHWPTYRDGFRELWDSINAAPKPCYARDADGKRVISCYVSYPWEDVTETREHRGKPWYVWGNPWVWIYDFERSKP